MTITYSGTTKDLNAIVDQIELRSGRIESTVRVAPDGSVVGGTNDVTEEYISMIVKCSETEKVDLKSFFETTLGFKSNVASLDPPSGINLGSGDGTARNVRFWSDEFRAKMQFLDIYYIPLLFRVENS